jgi:hypothetical protein
LYLSLVGLAQEIMIEQRKAAQANPVIVGKLREGVDPRLIGEEIARRFDLDAVKAYQWVVITEQSFDRSRRRIALAGVVLLSIGFAVSVAAIVMRLFWPDVIRRLLIVGLATGLPAAGIGLSLGLASRRLAR